MKKDLPPGFSRYFIAIIPPSPVSEEIQMLQDYFKEQYQSRAALNAPPHITLYLPFLWEDREEDLLVSSLKDFFASQPLTAIELSNFSSFPPRVIFIRVCENEKLNSLQDELVRFCKTTLNEFRAEYRNLPYHPHLTVAFRDLKKLMFTRAWQEFRERKFSAAFRVDNISLLKHNGNSWLRYRDFHF